MDATLDRQETDRAAPRPRRRMSYEAFMASTADQFAEWVDGEVIHFSSATSSHQCLLGFLSHLLDLHVHLSRLGRILLAPYAMRAETGGAVREPDILFVAQENASRLTERLLVGPADLVVEVVSDDSVRRDRDERYHEYRRAGVREYWVIDPRPERRRADFFQLVGDQYELFATDEDERVDSTVLSGFWLRPAWLWEADERDPLLTFFEMRGLSPEQIEEMRRVLGGGGER